MAKEKILIVDNDVNYCNTLKHFLSERGYTVLVAYRGQDAIDTISASSPDLVLIETVLPDLDGTEVIERVRQFSHLPIIVVSARLREKDKIFSLDLGADDYIVKPFFYGELLARIRVAFRHREVIVKSAKARVDCAFTVRGLKIDYLKHRVFLDDTEIKLTPNEFKIVSILSKRSGEIVTYKQLLHELFGTSALSSRDNGILRVHMRNLRRKIERDSSAPSYLFTEAGVGYMLVNK